MDRNRIWALAAIIGFLATTIRITGVHAAAMLSPVSATTDMGESAQNAGVGKMFDQSGLDKPFTSGVTDFDTYFMMGDPPFAQAAGGNNWQSLTQNMLPVTGNVDFDFGAVHSIDRLAIWNISMKDIKIHTSATSLNALTEVGSFAMPSHVNFPFSYSPDLLDLGSARDARFVRIEIDSVHLFDPSFTFGFAIVGEVVASAVPAAVDADGDYNGNGTVDAADYVVWRDTLGQAGAGLAADGDNDDMVDEGDYDVWRTNFGDIAAASATVFSYSTMAVPEPTAAVVLWAAAPLIFGAVTSRLSRRRAA